MTAILTYHHDTGHVKISFHLEHDEMACAVGFGRSCQEAEDNLKGWLEKGKEELKKRYECDREKPFIAMVAQRASGEMVRVKPCVNFLERFPMGAPNQITVRTVIF